MVFNHRYGKVAKTGKQLGFFFVFDLKNIGHKDKVL